MPVISDDSVIQIKLKMVIWIAVVIVTAIGTLGTWQQMQISSLKEEIKEEKVRVYIIETEDVPELLMYLSSHQSQLNTLNTVIFGKPIETNIGNNNVPSLPKMNNH